MDFDEFGDNFFVTKKINITMKILKIKGYNNLVSNLRLCVDSKFVKDAIINN